MASTLPFKTTMNRRRPAAQAAPAPVPAVPAAPDLASIDLLDLDIIPEQWQRMSVADKAARIAEKLSVDATKQIALISRLDQLHPPPRVVEYKERILAVPATREYSYAHPCLQPVYPAGQAVPQPMITPVSVAVWGVMFLIAGGLLYATVNIK